MTAVDVIDAEIVRTGTEWADVIRADMARTAESIVSTGRHLVAAKADVGHGGWLPLLEEVGISQRVAQEFMSLARNAALANTSNYSHLPSSPTALYQLSRLAPEVIESGIEHGDIHPAMTIGDAKGYAQEVTERAPANVNTETGEIAPEPKRDRVAEKLARHVDLANGLRNDLDAIAAPYLMYVNGVADNLPAEKMPAAANTHVADVLRRHLEEITASLTQAIAAIEGDQS